MVSEHSSIDHVLLCSWLLYDTFSSYQFGGEGRHTLLNWSVHLTIHPQNTIVSGYLSIQDTVFKFLDDFIINHHDSGLVTIVNPVVLMMFHQTILLV